MHLVFPSRVYTLHCIVSPKPFIAVQLQFISSELSPQSSKPSHTLNENNKWPIYCSLIKFLHFYSKVDSDKYPIGCADE